VLRRPREKRSHTPRDKADVIWIHFDADVLDDGVMPAVDYRLSGGLTRGEIGCVLSNALAHPGAVGMEITIFNPRLDTDGTVLRDFVDMLVSIFLKASRAGVI
jgi:arginase